MSGSKEYSKQFSPIIRALLLAPSIVLALAIYMANINQVESGARLLGYASAPFLMGFIGVGAVWLVKKMLRHKESQVFKKRPFVDYFIIWTLVLTILGALSRISQNAQY